MFPDDLAELAEDRVKANCAFPKNSEKSKWEDTFSTIHSLGEPYDIGKKNEVYNIVKM